MWSLLNKEKCLTNIVLQKIKISCNCKLYIKIMSFMEVFRILSRIVNTSIPVFELNWK